MKAEEVCRNKNHMPYTGHMIQDGKERQAIPCVVYTNGVRESGHYAFFLTERGASLAESSKHCDEDQP